LGESALAVNTTGCSNVAIGHISLDANTTGNFNTAVGKESLTSNTTGGCNTAVGRASLNDNTTGYQNTAVGYTALTNNTTGFNNSAIGQDALGSNSGGNCNTGLGQNAGYDVSTGDNNLLLGRNAGRSSSPSGAITTGSDNVVLGDDNISNLFCADTSISSSDLRDKTDIEDFTHGLDFVTKLNPKTYRWDKRAWYITDDNQSILDVTPDGSKKKNKKHIGFLAQDVLALEQEIGFANDRDDMLVVNQTEDETRYGLKYERLVPVLVNAIKELSETNKDLKSRIEALESN